MPRHDPLQGVRWVSVLWVPPQATQTSTFHGLEQSSPHGRPPCPGGLERFLASRLVPRVRFFVPRAFCCRTKPGSSQGHRREVLRGEAPSQQIRLGVLHAAQGSVAHGWHQVCDDERKFIALHLSNSAAVSQTDGIVDQPGKLWVVPRCDGKPLSCVCPHPEYLAFSAVTLPCAHFASDTIASPCGWAPPPDSDSDLHANALQRSSRGCPHTCQAGEPRARQPRTALEGPSG